MHLTYTEQPCATVLLSSCIMWYMAWSPVLLQETNMLLQPTRRVCVNSLLLLECAMLHELEHDRPGLCLQAPQHELRPS